jgi:hypothetical protein
VSNCGRCASGTTEGCTTYFGTGKIGTRDGGTTYFGTIRIGTPEGGTTHFGTEIGVEVKKVPNSWCRTFRCRTLRCRI